jgi:hypothetical protein
VRQIQFSAKLLKLDPLIRSVLGTMLKLCTTKKLKQEAIFLQEISIANQENSILAYPVAQNAIPNMSLTLQPKSVYLFHPIVEWVKLQVQLNSAQPAILDTSL